MNFEDAANILDPETSLDTLNKIKYYAGFRGEDAVQEAVTEACRIAAAVLRNRATGDPLSLEQLRGMDGQPVWVEFEDGTGGLWGIVHISIFEQIVFPNGLHCTIGMPYYGKTYKAYTYQTSKLKPREYTDEEIAEITGYKCPICANHKLCCMPYMKPLCGERYDHFSPLKQTKNTNNL